MGYLTCRCGNVIDLKTGVEEYEKKLLDSAFINERFPELIGELPYVSSSPFVSVEGAQIDFVWREIDAASTSVTFCQKCGRFWILEKSTGKYSSYLKEGGA